MEGAWELLKDPWLSRLAPFASNMSIVKSPLMSITAAGLLRPWLMATWKVTGPLQIEVVHTDPVITWSRVPALLGGGQEDVALLIVH